MGVALGSAVVPIAICVCWKKANKWGCVLGSVAGFVCGLIAWLVCTSTRHNGVLNVTVRLYYAHPSVLSLTGSFRRLLVVTKRCLLVTLPPLALEVLLRVFHRTS